MKDPMRILIAEVDPIIKDQLIIYLSKLGHEVFPTVLSGEDLMEQVKLLSPSLIITDIHLNGQLDGIEAIARLESIFKIPYIFITAYDDYSRLINSYYLNPVSIIKKPIDQINLQKSIEKAQQRTGLININNSQLAVWHLYNNN
jgi:two-component SAPR family response regulator